MTESQKVRDQHKQFMLPATVNYYEEPLVLRDGKGRHVRDADGREYLDFFAGILTSSVGHAHPTVLSSVHAQVDKLLHTSTLYPTEPMVSFAEALMKRMPKHLQKVFFTASGTEADETAVMLAMASTGRQELVALRHGYSGRSALAQSLMGHASYRALPTAVAGIKHAVSPYCYRCPFGLKYPSCELRCATDVEELIRTTTTGQIAGMLAEPIQGVGGFITPPKEYFTTVIAIVRKYGGLFIADEVQTGFGRTGGKMWGFEHYGIAPDLVTMAKGIAAGLPLAATVTTDAVATSLKHSSISTFGGNPVSCAAANAVLTVIDDEKLCDNAEARGKELRGGLELLKQKYKTVGDVRGMGLMQAMELVKDEPAGDRTPNPTATVRLFEETRKRGLLIGRGGLYGNTVRIAPPLNVTSGEVAEALKVLDQSLAVVA